MPSLFVCDYPFSLAAASARDAVDRRSEVSTVERGRDGRLDTEVGPTSLSSAGEDVIIDALISASAEQDIAETRIW